MSTLYIHIGTMKTGTTAIQSFLSANQDILEKKGYCYPLMYLGIPGKYKQRNAQFLTYRSRKKGEEKRQEEKRVREAGFAIIEEASQKYENIVISDEILWYRQNAKEFWESSLPRFKNFGCKVKVIVYLRRQDLLIQSYWNQCVKGEPRTDSTFEKYIDNKEYAFCNLDYYEQLQMMLKYFQKEDIIVRPYENGQYEGTNHTLIADFLQRIGLELTDEYIQEKNVDNEGISGNFVEIKRAINQAPEYFTHPNFLRIPVTNACNAVGQIKESYFSYDKQVAFVEQFKESNAAVAREFLNRPDGKLYYQDIKELPEAKVNTETMYQDLALVMAEVAIAQRNEIEILKSRISHLERTTIYGLFSRVINKLTRLAGK